MQETATEILNTDKALGFVISLIIANWSALGIALKCRDKMDSARNLLWGLEGNPAPDNKEMALFIMRNDIIMMLVALVWIFVAVGVILLIAASYMQSQQIEQMLIYLYRATGGLLVLAAIGTAIFGYVDAWKIWRITLARIPN